MPTVADADRDAGLARQLERLGDRDVGGWKVGLTSGAARDGMGPGFRPFGYILKERVFRSGKQLALADFASVGADAVRVSVENELCFRLGEALPGDADRDAAIAAVDCVAPAFEIGEARLPPGATAAERLADNLGQYAVVVGPEVRRPWAAFDFDALVVALKRNDALVQSVAAAGHIDDHFASIAALARQLARFGRRLAAGDRVITGSYTRHRVAAAGIYCGEFGPPFAPVRVEFR